jgi:dihydrofolate reductase
VQDFAKIWQVADKIVYSRTLQTVMTARTRFERDFDPEAIRQMKAATDRDILIDGSELAAYVFRAGLVDACHLFLAPVIVGAGERPLPSNIRLELALLTERHFDNQYLRQQGGKNERSCKIENSPTKVKFAIGQNRSCLTLLHCLPA